MMPPLLAKTFASPRDRWLVALIGFLLVGQVAAFWMLCQSQVRRAEVRHAGRQVERMALADCLQYIPKATLGSCATRVAPQPQPAIQPVPASMSAATVLGNSAVR